MKAMSHKSFTGYHMAAILIGFFGVVIAVNIYMAKLAVGTFGGTIVDNSYVASQNYNDWLAEGKRQADLGWAATASRADNGRVRVAISEKSAAGSGFAVAAVAQHPLGRAPQVRLSFTDQGNGEWLSNEAVPSGRWQLQIGIARGRDRYRLQSEVQ
jgi:nitrogen fixation protein FixH